MKKRILFVDDDPMVLQGLQRLLRSMRNEWEMEFVDNGENALRALERQGADVIVSDMRMPGMNGAELLGEVMRRFPATVRLILSGYADKDLILKCVGSTHQFLSKPCDPDTLKATIMRASSVEGALQSERIKSLVCQLSRLPSIPDLYMEILEKASRPETTLEDIGSVMARDVGMTAQILKLSNSAFFGLRRQLASPEMAVGYLGLDTIKALILSIHAFSQFDGLKSGGLKIKELWSHSLEVAGSAKWIAATEPSDGQRAEEAFAAGMLHDIGKLILAINLPEESDHARRLAVTERIEDHAAEQSVFGANHADVGGYLIGLWGLPVPVVEAVALHHAPDRAPLPEFSPLTCVHAANVFENERALGGDNARPALNLPYFERLGMADRPAVWRAKLFAS